MVIPLDLAEFDGLGMGMSFSCFQDPGRFLFIGEVALNLNFIERYPLVAYRPSPGDTSLTVIHGTCRGHLSTLQVIPTCKLSLLGVLKPCRVQ